MARQTHEGQAHGRTANVEVMAGVVQDDAVNIPGLVQGQVCRLRLTPRGELKVSVDSDINLTSTTEAKVTAAAPSYAEGALEPFSMDRSGDLRTRVTDVQGVPDAAAPTEALQAGGVANASAPTPDEADMGALSMDLFSGLRTRIDRAQGTHDAAAPAEMVMEGGYATATVPAAVATGDAVRPWRDTRGREIGFADVMSSQARAVTQVSAPPTATLGPVSFTQIDEPGETAATDIENLDKWCYQVTVGGVPAASTIVAEGSHDNSNWFTLTADSTAVAGLAVSANIGTISAAGVYEWKGSGFASKYIRLSVMNTSGSPDAATFDIQLMAKK